MFVFVFVNKKSDSDIVQVIVPKEENVYSNLFMFTMLKIAVNSKGVRPDAFNDQRKRGLTWRS